MTESDVDRLPNPPDAPETRRSVSMHTYQWIGIPLLLLVPLLAVLGAFGESWQTARAKAGPLDVTVTYPTKYRYKQINSMEVHVRNTGASVLDTVTVAFDTVYGTRFSTITSVPAFTDAFEVSLVALQPGESRLAWIELQAERYWRHQGDLSITAGAADTIRIPLSTIVYP